MTAATVLLLFTTAVSAGDLASITAEPNLERRSERALDNADRSITTAREAYVAGNSAGAATALEEVVASAELSSQALSGTGKSPRRSPKYFKRAELRLREMLRRLDSLENEFDASDRAMVVRAKERLHQVHDDLLNGIMSKKK